MTYKYKAAADAIKQRIYSKEYRPGEKLPSVQGLSKEFAYNSDTIVKAYKLLESEHLIYAVPKSGYYVVKSGADAEGGNCLVDMVTVCPPDRINPYKDFYHCMEKAIALYEKKLFDYSSPKGMPELVNVLVKHLMDFKVFTRPENIFITNGAQQALYILGAMPFPGGGTKVLVEQPTYAVMLQVMKCTRTPVIGIRRTSEGVDLNELEAIFKQGDIKFFYTMPRYQNPTGFCYEDSQKKEIIRLAKKYHVYIVEDDYLADLELDTKVDPMYGLGEQDLIIYIRSFSKTLLPGLRLGMGILPAELHAGFLAYKRSIDLNTPILTQGALEIYLKSSMYKFHVQRTKKYYKEKMDVLREECKQQLQDRIRWYIPSTGIYAYMEVDCITAETLVNRLSKRGVLVSGTNDSYIEGFQHPEGLRLCVCNTEEESIRRTVRLIRQELECLG